jgi:hypothetical protein
MCVEAAAAAAAEGRELGGNLQSWTLLSQNATGLVKAHSL